MLSPGIRNKVIRPIPSLLLNILLKRVLAFESDKKIVGINNIHTGKKVKVASFMTHTILYIIYKKKLLNKYNNTVEYMVSIHISTY